MSDEQILNEPYDAIVVLGASVRSDGSPSTILQDRIDAAIKLYEAGVAPCIIMSGDGRETNYNEPAAMKSYAVSCGVPSEDIYCDPAGLTTYESMYRIAYADEISALSLKRIVVVTQDYHLSRALFAAQGLGLSVLGASSDYHSYEEINYYYLREFFARIKDAYQVLIKQEARDMITNIY